jgi:hypothetical protein
VSGRARYQKMKTAAHLNTATRCANSRRSCCCRR